MALDSFVNSPENYRFDPAWQRELDSVSHREYGTGFFFHDPKTEPNLVTQPGYIREKAYLAVCTGTADEKAEFPLCSGIKLCGAASVELLSPGRPGQPFTADPMWTRPVRRWNPHPIRE